MTGASRRDQIAASSTYLIPAVAGQLIPLITLPIFTRLLTPADYGAWALALAYATFVTGVANFGLTICYDRCFFEYRDGRAGALLYSIIAFVAMAYAACLVATWWWRGPIAALIIGTPAAGTLLFWVTVASGMASLKWYYLAYLRNSGDAKAYVWFTLDETLLATALSLALVAGLRVGVIGLPVGLFVAAAAMFVLVTMRFVRTVPPAFSATLLREALKLSYPLTPRIFLGVVANNFDKYLLGLLSSVGSVGVFVIGQKISYLVFAYMTALENVFAPEVYRRMFEKGPAGGRSIGRYLTPFVFASVAVAVLVSLFSEEALTVLTPGAYHGAIPVVNLLTLYYAVMFFGKQPQLVYAKKTYLLSVLTIISLTANVVFNVAGIQLLGMIGAAAGTLCAGITGVVVYNLVAARYYRIEWELTRLLAILGFLVVTSSAAMLMVSAGVAYPLRLAVKLLLCAAYLGLGARLGIVTRENLRMVLSIVSGRMRRAAPRSA